MTASSSFKAVLDLELDQKKVYCNACRHEGVMTPLELDESHDGFYKAPNCGHFKSNFYRYQWLPKLQHWGAVRGLRVAQESFYEQLEQRKVPGPCLICGKHCEKRDYNFRGFECGCHDKWYLQHNRSEQMREQAKQVGLATGSKHITQYNQSELHSESVRRYFQNLTHEERQVYGDRLNDARRANIAREHGFETWEQLEAHRQKVLKLTGYSDFNELYRQVKNLRQGEETFEQTLQRLGEQYQQFLQLYQETLVSQERVILDFDKDNVSAHYAILRALVQERNLRGHYVTLLYTLDDPYSKDSPQLLTAGVNEKKPIDAFAFLRLCSRARWDVQTMDERNYKIKHDYFSYRLVLYHGLERSFAYQMEKQVATDQKALYWRPLKQQ